MRKTVDIVRRIASIVLLLVACISKIQAQTYPVHVATQALAPYSPFLTDYTEIGAQRFVVNFRLNDPTLPEYRGKLRLTIEGVGITIRTKQNFIPQQPLVLQGGGIPLTLYGEDLEEYFNPNNLDFAGISRNQYEKGAKLPEGVYRFTVEVLDYNRGTVVSNKGTAIAWIILNDPVLLNLPKNGTKVSILDPTNLVFNWTPRHTASPNSAFTAEYVFRLVEIWPASRNPYDAFLSQQSLYETTTTATQIVYGPAEPALIPGRKYAWQVQAKDTEGRDLFKNDGKSEVYVFQFGDELGIPERLSLQKANPSSLIVRWEQPVAGTDAVTYTVRYRPHGKRNHDNWYTEKTSDQWRAIPQLQPNTEYEVQVRAEQGAQVSDYGAVKIFKTAIAGANDFVCKSDVSPPKVPANTIPATKLAINDTIYAAGYEVLVRELTANEGGTYTGSGMMIVPWFQSAKVRMTFKNIRVNEQHWLTAGEINSVWNADSKFLVKSEKKVDSTNAPLNGNLPVNIVATETLIEITGAAIATVIKDEEGNIEVYTTDGDKKVLPKGKSYSIADEVGNGYVVDAKGNITKTTAEEARNAAGRGDRNYTIALTFSKGEGKYGFDEKKYEALSSYYQQLDGGQYIPWKAVTASQPDAVAATLEGTDIAADKVRFEINGSKVSASNNGNNYTLNVRGGAGGMVEELLALYTPTDTSKDNVLGKLNLVSYDELTRNLVIVPVNGATIPGGLSATILSQNLTAIYGQAVAKWDVKLESSINVSLNDTFDDGETGLLTNYTGDMKKVIKAYGKLQDKTYYIFLVTKPKSGVTLGYMPRSKQAGFIFVDKLNSTNIVNTLAHEIGHGAFNLQHTFKEYPSLAQGSTDNLMDYANGTSLYKYQWDQIHDPQKVIALFEDDEDSQYSTGEYFSKVLQQIRCAYASGVSAIDLPEKFRSSQSGEVGAFDYGLPATDGEINGLKLRSASWKRTSKGNQITGIISPRIDAHKGEIQFGDFLIKVSAATYNINNGLSPFEHFKRYLCPTESEVIAEFNKVWNSGIKQKIANKEELSLKDINYVKQIASCASRYLDVESRYRLVQAVMNYSTWEYYEDLILDIIQSTPPGAASKDLFAKINSNKDLLVQLIRSMDNYGGDEKNFDRLAKEFYSLFTKGHTKDELGKIYAELPENQKLYFYGFGKICEWSISASRSYDAVTFDEHQVFNVQYRTYNPTQDGSSLPTCDSENQIYSVGIQNLVAVNFLSDNFLAKKGETIIIPASVYYILIKSHWNEQYYQASNAAWVAVGILTPIDEFYLLGKALQYSHRGLKALRLGAVKTLAKNNKIEVSLTDQGQELKKLSEQNHVSVDEYVSWEVAKGGTNKIGTIDDAIKGVAPYLDELKDLGISVRKMSQAEANALALVKSNNSIKAEVNVAKVEVTVKNGQSYTSHAASGYPDPKVGNILKNPEGAVNPVKGNSVFEPHTSNWEGRSRINDTEVKLLEEFALKNGAKPNVPNQVINGVEGEIKLYTQLCPCGSCANVIKEFKKMFPNVNLEIVTNPIKSFK